MAEPTTAILDLASPQETDALAHRIAPRLQPGDILLLEGPVGVGKTHFARALIKARMADEGREEDVPSPTFTLVQIYESGGTEIWHADLYRLSGSFEVAELGLEDAFGTAICIVEWPDRLGGKFPSNAITLSFETVDADRRRLTASGDVGRWYELLGVRLEAIRAG